MKFYTGIGSRETPIEILDEMKYLASKLSEKYFILRSGGAKGADSAFESGSLPILKNIYYATPPKYDSEVHDGIVSSHVCDFNTAMNIASKYHPYWYSLKYYSKLLMARNVFQVLGHTMNIPSELVIAWTPNGLNICDEFINRSGINLSDINSYLDGGTSLAIKLAIANNIPVYNLRNESDRIALYDRLDLDIDSRLL